MKTYSEHDLFSFAFCGTKEFFRKNVLNDLIAICEREKWASLNAITPNDILFYYIIKTFERISQQNKIVYSDNNEAFCFNTGLLTEKAEEIYGWGEKNTFVSKDPTKKPQEWYFKGFCKASDRVLDSYHFHAKPEMATYFDDPKELYFDPTKDIDLAIDHILDDHWDRPNLFPESIKTLGKSAALGLIQYAYKQALIRVKRNTRLMVPQYYNGKLMFFMPIVVPVVGERTETLALAVEPVDAGGYRANTVFSLEDAYKKARLINKPESNWLI